jgi:WD40 repeat protein
MTTMNHSGNHLGNMAGYNDQALQELAWAIEASSGEFSLTLAHCNYVRLRQQLIERLQILCSPRIQTISLQPTTTTLYTAIQETLQGKTPTALMVLGLESITNLPQALSSANKVREEFRKSFPFPIVLWVNDRVLEQLTQWAPDFKSWATTTEFVISTDTLLQGIQEETDGLFYRLLDPHTEESLSNVRVRRWEAHAALQDLHQRGQVLEPALKASMDFVLGREADTQAKQEFEAAQEVSANRYMEAARQFYQQSLDYWQQVGNLERQGILLHHLGQNYCRQAEYYEAKPRLSAPYSPKKLSFYWEKAKYYLHQCLTVFSQARRPDLVAEFITDFSEVLEHQEDWHALQQLAEKSLTLHQPYEDFRRLAQDYSFLANVALHQSRWQDAYENAQQVLDIVRTKIADRPQLHQTGLFLLAQAQQQLGQISEAIVSLEDAWKVGEQIRESGAAHPQLDLRILALLYTLYQQQQRYLEAFRVKHTQYSIEQQYGLRAFIGPGRLKSQRQVYFAPPETGQPATIAQEILASGRQQNVQELVNRIKEYRFKLTILYGQSGVGKSSVIEAGLIPALKQETVRGLDIVPVLLRNYTHWIEELGTRLSEALKETTIPCSPELNTTSAILEQLERNEQHHLLTVLIFDQFEEFFFICRDLTEHQQFADFLRQCLNLGEVKIILSLREDYLHRLLQYSHDMKQTDVQNDILNNILNQDNLYYIGNLAPEDTQSLIQILTQRSQAYQPELVKTVVKDLAFSTGDVRPIELQIVGFQLEEENITTLAQYPANGTQALVRRYLKGVVADCGIENQRAAELVLYLLTDENNTRPIKTQAQLETDLQSIAQELLQEASKLSLVLQIFVEAGIVLLMRESPANRYQLVHDYLVTVIRHQSEARLPQLKLELEKEKSQRQHAEAERDRALRNLHQQNHQLKRLNSTLAQQKTGLEKTRQNLVAAAVLLLALTGAVTALSLQIRRSEVSVMASHAEALLASNQELDALVESLRALESSKALVWVNPILPWLHQNMRGEIKQVLQESIDTVREVDRLEAHHGAVRSISFSPDGQTIATAGEDNTIKLWNLQGRPPLTIPTAAGHTGPVYSVSFSPDGQTLATASADRTVKLWCQGCQWSCPYTLKEHQGAVFSVAYSPDGQTLATASADRTVKLWNRDGQLLRTLEAHQAAVRSASFSPDGQTLATAGEDHLVKLWTADGTLFKTLTGHQGPVYSVSFSPGSQFLATASADKTVKLWRRDGELLHTLVGHQGPVYSVSFSPDAQTIATAGEDHMVKLWSLDGQLLQTLTGHEEPIYQVKFNPDGTLATASADTTVKLWKLNSRLREHRGPITAVGFSPVDQNIVTAGEDNTVKLWNQDGRYLRSLGNHQTPVRSISFSPDGQTIATAGNDHAVQLWNLKGQVVNSLTGHQASVNSISFSPDGQWIATASSDSTVKLWNPQGSLLKTLPHDRPVLWVGFNSDSQTLLTVSQNYTIQLWGREGTVRKALTRKKLHDETGQNIASLKVSPNGQIIAVVDRVSNTVTLWDINQLWDRKTIEDEKITALAPLPHEKPLEDFSFSPDSQFFATASKDKQVRLWTLEGKVDATFPDATFTWHNEGFVEHLTFSADPEVIALSSTSGKIILWNWRQGVDELEQLSCNRVQGYLQRLQSSQSIDRLPCNPSAVSSERSLY